MGADAYKTVVVEEIEYDDKGRVVKRTITTTKNNSESKPYYSKDYSKYSYNPYNSPFKKYQEPNTK